MMIGLIHGAERYPLSLGFWHRLALLEEWGAAAIFTSTFKRRVLLISNMMQTLIAGPGPGSDGHGMRRNHDVQGPRLRLAIASAHAARKTVQIHKQASYYLCSDVDSDDDIFKKRPFSRLAIASAHTASETLRIHVE